MPTSTTFTSRSTPTGGGLATPMAEASGWIVNSQYDQFFLVGAWLVPFLLTVIAAFTGWLIPAVLFLILDRSHVTATIPLTVLDRDAMNRSGRFYVVGFCVLISLSIASAYGGPSTSALWASVFLYWGPYHIIRQHYGFLKLYQAKSGRVSKQNAQAEIVSLYSGLAFPFLFTLSTGDAILKTGMYLVPVPKIVPWVCLLIFILSTIFVVVESFRRWLAGQDIGWTRLLHIALAVSNFCVGFMIIGHNNIAITALFITSYHNLQYHAIVRLVGFKRYNRAEHANVFATVLAHQSAIPYALLVLGLAAVLMLGGGDLITSAWYQDHPTLSQYAINIVWAFVYAHYLFDGKMWQMRNNPTMRVDLGLSRPATIAT